MSVGKVKQQPQGEAGEAPWLHASSRRWGAATVSAEHGSAGASGDRGSRAAEICSTTRGACPTPSVFFFPEVFFGALLRARFGGMEAATAGSLVAAFMVTGHGLDSTGVTATV